ncbi:Uncharacterised protein [Mycobacteroides abscessus subsp. abscessus]|nr:Uncharacterised protein [Mycobacteroides abscessus subsp. abscessus]
MGIATSASGSRSGSSVLVLGPRSPPNPPSPLAKIDERVVHSGAPSEPVMVCSCTITAAEPLSHSSLIRPVLVALPAAGIGRCTCTSWWACTTLARSMSMPGKLTFGGSVSCRVCATVAKVGSTCGSRSSR